MLFAVRVGRQLIDFLARPFLRPPEEPEPRLLVINSKQDEAYRLLSGVLWSKNPLVTETDLPLIKKCWITAKRCCKNEEKHIDWRVTCLMTLITVTAGDLLFSTPMMPYAAYWMTVAALALLVFLNIFSGAAILGLSYLYYLINVSCAFGLELLKYPFTFTMTTLGRRLGWRTIQEYALGMLGSPRGLRSVSIEPTFGDHGEVARFKEFPRDVIDNVVNLRNHSTKQELEKFIDSLSTSEWTIESVQRCWEALNMPGLVHSCYYSLDHEWTINAIVEHILQYKLSPSAGYTWMSRRKIRAIERQTEINKVD